MFLQNRWYNNVINKMLLITVINKMENVQAMYILLF